MMVVDVVREDLLPDPEREVLDSAALCLCSRQRLDIEFAGAVSFSDLCDRTTLTQVMVGGSDDRCPDDGEPTISAE